MSAGATGLPEIDLVNAGRRSIRSFLGYECGRSEYDSLTLMQPVHIIAGRYHLMRLLGRGGMGEVWLARDHRLEREIAVKLLRDVIDDQSAERFLREARAAAMLVHPGIITVFDFGEEDKQLFIAMEYVPGEPLSETIRQRRELTVATRLRLIDELCSALTHAHSRNVVHRDIKPANLMLTIAGRLKVLDFGIARLGTSTLTGGHLLGSLNYMSPEQLALLPVDPRSDIFAVGAVMFELLTYEQAFSGDTPDAIAAKIRAAPAQLPESACAHVDRELIAVIRTALAHDPSRRFQDVASMQRAIRTVMRRLGEPGIHDAETVDVGAAADPAGIPQPRLESSRRGTDTDPETRGLMDRASAGLPPLPSSAEVAIPTGWFRKIQARLLNRRAKVDYAVLALFGAIPMMVAWRVDALRSHLVMPGTRLYDACGGSAAGTLVIRGYGTLLNWWPYFVALPFVLFMTRFTATHFFPLEFSDQTMNRGLLLRIGEAHRPAVARGLAQAALDPRNLRTVIALAVLLNAIDTVELGRIYIAPFGAGPLACPRELDWTVLFLSESIPRWQNALLVAIGYTNQIVIHGLAILLFGLLLRHNWFYLRSIYQRHRTHGRAAGRHIILDFNDVERCFGLRVLHSTFNFQILLLIMGGAVLTVSRALNVDPTVGEEYQRLLSGLFAAGEAISLPAQIPVQWSDLFPDVGQIMLTVAWVTCFVIVALPGAVKFLPILNRGLNIVGRKDYLLEFLPPNQTPPLETQDQVDALARKFARSSFWPAGDDRARTLYVVAYFVTFFVLFPVPPEQGVYLVAHVATLTVVSIGCMRLTFWVFQKLLVNIDASLAER